MAVSLERQKDEFLANVSHDLRTPLGAITVSIGAVLVNAPPDLPPRLHRLLVTVDGAAVRMTRLVDDLLELTRLQAGRVDGLSRYATARALTGQPGFAPAQAGMEPNRPGWVLFGLPG